MAQFQFHKGAIRTQSGKEGWQTIREFQFHKGAIRTMISARGTGAPPFHFNSIKVRLEHGAGVVGDEFSQISIP